MVFAILIRALRAALLPSYAAEESEPKQKGSRNVKVLVEKSSLHSSLSLAASCVLQNVLESTIQIFLRVPRDCSPNFRTGATTHEKAEAEGRPESAA